MTGNTVLIAIDLASGRGMSAALSAVALAGFVTGAAVGGAANVRISSTARFVAVAAVTEAALLGAAAAIWQIFGRSGSDRYPVMAALGAAMGLQSATVANLDVGVSTTYITGTWTAVSRFVGGRGANRRQSEPVKDPPHRLQAAVLGCYFLSALVAAAIYRAA